MFKKLLSLSLLAAALTASAVDVPLPRVVLQGVMVSNDNWTSTSEAGIYNIDVRPGGAITPIHRSSAMANIIAAINHNGTLYAVESDNYALYYRQFSANDWSSKGAREEIDMQNVPSDLAYDAVTGKVYGGFWDEEYGGFSRFASFSLSTAEASDVKGAARDERDIFALAAAPDGTMYALFGAYNYLATINTKNGALERIGLTGLSINYYLPEIRVNSMCYDEANDRLLAVVYHYTGPRFDKKNFSSLYSINPHTAEATLIMELPGAPCFAGLRVLSNEPSETAPAVVRNLVAANGTISFDVPTTSVGGAPLAGPLMAIINLNGTETVKEDIQPGSHVTVDGLTFADGMNTVKVTLASATERGATATLNFRNGEDIPAAVSDLTLAIADGTATLSWKAPTTGASNGTVNPANLRYRIVRYPDGKTMASAHTATTFTDNTILPTWKSVYYTVTAYNNQGESVAVNSNRCPGSGALSVPFSETFDTADDFNAWTIVDLNGSVTWTYDKSGKRALYDFPRDDTPGDDWLISPPIVFEAGKTYKVTYDYRAYSKNYSESFEVAILGDIKEFDNANVIAKHSGFNHTNYEHGEATTQPDVTGPAYLAFHATSAPRQWSFYIDNITIEVIDTRVPAAVTDLAVTPAANGELKASISFTTPTTDIDGAPLVGLTKAEVRRSDLSTVVATVTNPEAGKLITVDDTPAASGTYTYSVVCFNGAGASVSAQASTFVGVDVPGAVGELTVAEVDRHPVLTWTAPTKGANGGWFDSSNVTYRIVRSDGTVVAEKCAALTFTDKGYTSPATSQDAVWYLVTPYCGTAKGAYAQSDLLLVGQSYKAPATETFANIGMIYYPWITQTRDFRNQNWTLDAMGTNPSCADYTGDGGLATFRSVGEKPGSTAWYYSPMFDIAGLDSPELSFAMYHSPSIEGDASLEIFVSTGEEFKTTGTVIRRDASEQDGWKRHSVDLSAYMGATRLRVAFLGTADGKADICLDGIELSSVLIDDYRITSCAGPTKIGKGLPGTYELTVYNAGRNDIEGGNIVISDGTEVLFTEMTANIPVGESITIRKEFTFNTTGTHNIEFTAKSDKNGAGSDSRTLSVNVVEPVVPKPQSLAVAETAGGAKITWVAPDYSGSVTDDFESYADYAISGIGDWTMYDGDNAPTCHINMSAVGEYPNCSAPKAFQLLNCATLGINIWEQGKAHSGNKLMAAMACIGYVNDDWMISPMLNGKGQWISFWARSFTNDFGAERMKVLTSSTNTNPASFTAITENYVELGASWREYRFWMPEGTRYFAINCVSEDAFAMFVDDARFNGTTVPTWTVIGYEVLRDGTAIATVEVPEYVDADAHDGAVYTVRALYAENGKSDESDPVTFTSSSVISPVTGNSEVEAIYTPAGVKIEGRPSRGIYIVRYRDGHAEKKTF